MEPAYELHKRQHGGGRSISTWGSINVAYFRAKQCTFQIQSIILDGFKLSVESDGFDAYLEKHFGFSSTLIFCFNNALTGQVSMDTQKSILDQQYKDPSEKRAVYVGNLPPGVTDNSIREIFSICGSVHAVKLIGKSALNVTTIYAFVEYDDPASAQSAIETFNGRPLRKE